MNRPTYIPARIRTWATGLLLFVFAVAGAQHTELFEEGNELYNEGEYQLAIERYRSISDQGVHSPELYFNIGNAYYKLDKIAPSILYYEKALLLDPNDEDVKVNLEYARNMTIDDIEELPQSALSKLTRSVVGIFGHRSWSYLAIGSMFLFVFLLTGEIARYQGP